MKQCKCFADLKREEKHRWNMQWVKTNTLLIIINIFYFKLTTL